VRKGWVDVHAVPTREKAFGALEVYNGNLGPGVLNALYCCDRGIALAGQYGIGLVGLRNTTHWMRGGTYGLYVARKGCAAIAWTNAESVMPPWGGAERRLGNNPFVMAAPVLGEEPVMLDMAMSLYAYGKLQTLRLAGKKLPFPGGFDKNGVLTDEPGLIEESMRILPMGYWKGASFAFMLDILGAALSGGITAEDIDKNGKGSCGGASQVFIIIKPDFCGGAAETAEIIRRAKKHIKSSAPAEGQGNIRYPGEGLELARKENDEAGVFVDDGIWEEITALTANSGTD
jgi:3-dehydro-L-gulonate 2-dehydrogenase